MTHGIEYMISRGTSLDCIDEINDVTQQHVIW